MARKKKVTQVKYVPNKEEIAKKVDSLVDEIERTSNFRKIVKDEIKESPKEDMVEVESNVLEKKDKVEEKEVEVNKEEVVEEPEVLGVIKNTESFEEKLEEDKKDPENKKESIYKTNSFDFTFDDERLAELGSLDTSFLEGRIKRNSNVKEKKLNKINEDYDKAVKKEKKVTVKAQKRRSDDVIKPSKPKSFYVALVLILVLISGAVGFVISYKFAVKTTVKVKEKTITKEVKVVEPNYLFLGDSITDYYDLEKYYDDLPVVNSGISGDVTTDILDDMQKRVYQYNPSVVFLLIGTNDYVFADQDKIIERIGKIIDGIQKNRPAAKIYVESIYPVNNTDAKKIDMDMVNKRNNDDIQETNKELKKLCKEKKVTYINMYDLLYDEDDGGLKLDYTKEGLHITDEGYEVITKELKKYIES